MNVEDYYEKNTKRFLKHGTGKGEYAIHRPVFGPGVTSRRDAVHYAESLMIEEFQHHGIKTVIDLGCGVGGTMKFMFPRYGATYHGITLSPLQTDIGTQLLSGTPCTIMTGDMTELAMLTEVTKEMEKPAAAICIEAYLHLPSSSDLFANLSAVMSHGDIVILQDDFLRESDREEPIIKRFTDGWQANNLGTVHALEKKAKSSGFAAVKNTDLTVYLGPRRLSNILISLIVMLLRPFRPKGGWWDNFSGGDALQKCIARNLITYRQMVFIKE